jgi:hypothetical protein
MLPLNVTLSHYKRRDIQEEVIISANLREIAVKFGDKFGQRPDVLNNPADILELAKQKATSFHCSEELWKNPLHLNPNLKKQELQDLRVGWDLVLDIDCGIFEYSKIATDLIIKALKFHDLKSVSCKFSGNKGFHIGVPFEAFPPIIGNEKTRVMFPDAARRIAYYIKELIKRPLGEKIMRFENDDFSAIIQRTGRSSDDITYFEKNEYGDMIARLNVEPFLNIDTILISSRHLFRMPYSLHEKSGLVSLPINPEDVLGFSKENAKPENVKISEFRFLDKENAILGDARRLIMEAFDVTSRIQDVVEMEQRKNFEVNDAVKEDFFPPCMKHLKRGLSDGRKRAIFILINFLTSLGWEYKDIEVFLKEWNNKNNDPLRENYLVGQLRYHKSHKKKILPPNCNNMMYYVDMGICKPDNLCAKIKNPVSYAIKKAYFSNKKQNKKNEA